MTEDLQEEVEVSTERLEGFERKPGESPEPAEFDYMLLAEGAARLNLTEDWVIERLAEQGMVVDKIEGDVFLMSASWKAIRAVEDQMLKIAVEARAKKAGKPEPADPPEWSDPQFKNKIAELRKRAEEFKINFMVYWGACGCPGGLTTAKVKKLSEAIEQQISLKKDREFAALYGISYPADQVIPPGNILFQRSGYETTGVLPDYVTVDGEDYFRLGLLEDELGGSNEAAGHGESGAVCSDGVCGLDDRSGHSKPADSDDADSKRSEDGCAAGVSGGELAADVVDRNVAEHDGERRLATEFDFQMLLTAAQDAYDFLTLELKWDERSHSLTHPDMIERLEHGAVSPDDLRTLILLARDEGWVGGDGVDQAVVQGEVVEQTTDLIKREDGAIVDSFTGEVLSLCEMLGFNEEEAAKVSAGFNDMQAHRFIEKIRFLQTSTETVIGQAEAFVARNKAAIQQGMRLFGGHLRAWAEPRLARYTKDTKTKKKGDFKEKSVPTLVGDICFKATGGWKVSRKWELEKWLAGQLAGLSDEVEELVNERLQALPEPLKSIVTVEFKVKANAKAALKAAQDGAQLPGVEYLPKHELDLMLIGTNRRGWTITKPIETLNKRLKELQIACSEKEDDDE